MHADGLLNMSAAEVLMARNSAARRASGFAVVPLRGNKSLQGSREVRGSNELLGPRLHVQYRDFSLLRVLRIPAKNLPTDLDASCCWLLYVR